MRFHLWMQARQFLALPLKKRIASTAKSELLFWASNGNPVQVMKRNRPCLSTDISDAAMADGASSLFPCFVFAMMGIDLVGFHYRKPGSLPETGA
ncbi:hypothetical protein A5418_05855 [Geobacillus subterraneus]|nr:hypothetical protein A5418_05855 [Geobacillus subterraneus]